MVPYVAGLNEEQRRAYFNLAISKITPEKRMTEQVKAKLLEHLPTAARKALAIIGKTLKQTKTNRDRTENPAEIPLDMDNADPPTIPEPIEPIPPADDVSTEPGSNASASFISNLIDLRRSANVTQQMPWGERVKFMSNDGINVTGGRIRD